MNKPTWQEAKEACNRLRAQFWGGGVWDWVEDCNNALPKCVSSLLAHACAYNFKSDDVEVLKSAHRIMTDDDDWGE